MTNGINFYIEKQEALEILICVIAISLAMALLFGGFAIFAKLKTLAIVITLFAVTIGIGFIFHEMAHKLVAIYYGAYARFRMWPIGLLIMFVMVLVLGVLFAAPGAVYIYARSITKQQNGIISLAGPAANLLIAGVFFALALFAPIHFSALAMFRGNIWLFGAYFNTVLALFNMLPIGPLDGSKIWQWNFFIWLVSAMTMYAAWTFTGSFI